MYEVSSLVSVESTFPTWVFSKPVRRFVEEVASCVGCPIDFVGLSVLVAAAIAIRNRVAVQFKGGRSLTPLIWAVVVGGLEPGKPLAAEYAFQPINELGGPTLCRDPTWTNRVGN